MITPDPTFFCHECRNELVFEVKMGQRDSCPHCAADLHCCHNCQLHDRGAHNECSEIMSDYVPDKAKFNFCGYFKFIVGEREGRGQVDEAKAKLEALIAKK